MGLTVPAAPAPRLPECCTTCWLLESAPPRDPVDHLVRTRGPPRGTVGGHVRHGSGQDRGLTHRRMGPRRRHDRAVDLPLHWQAAVWLTACDVAGLTVVWDGEELVVTDDPSAPAGRALVSTRPFGLPTGAPAAMLDHARDAMRQPDDLLSVPIGGHWGSAPNSGTRPPSATTRRT